jgi:hypothetical protein
VAGNASATVSFTAPASDGGSAITGFQVDALTGTTLVSTTPAAASATSVVVTGLTNGTSYTFRVRAVNAAGTSTSSAASPAVTPAAATTAPGAPTIGAATGANASATVRWTAPTSNGGSAITGYQVDVLVGGVVNGAVRTAGAAATSLVVTGLTNGTSYTFRVRAVNAVGASGNSAASNAVTPAATVPGAPVVGTATGGNVSATVRWTAPASNGGSAITGYRVDVLVGGVVNGAVRTATAAARSLVVTGLTNGTTYTFRVRAVNAVGASANSAQSNAVRAATVPGAPVIGTAVAGAAGGTITATANWVAPASTGGSPITGYQVFALRMSSAAATATVLGTTTSPVLAATVRTRQMTLPAVGTYRFQVVAINAAGTSARSARSNAVAGR